MPDPVPPAVREFARSLADPQPMRRGSLTVRYMRCHKPGCRCATDPDARHGPYYSVSRVVHGRTRSQWVTPSRAAQVRAQVEAGRQFRAQIEAYWTACEAWAEAQVSGPEATSAEAAKKGASRAPSRRRSRGKLTR